MKTATDEWWLPVLTCGREEEPLPCNSLLSEVHLSRALRRTGRESGPELGIIIIGCADPLVTAAAKRTMNVGGSPPPPPTREHPFHSHFTGEDDEAQVT